jgi:probable HAF family extracellular repeat protein
LGGAAAWGFCHENDLGLAADNTLPGCLPGGASRIRRYSYKDLGTLGGDKSTANGINDRDQVVGWAENAKLEQRAFIWTRQAGMQDLNKLTIGLPSTVVLTTARAINKKGQIVGFARVRLLDHAFLLTPVTFTNVSTLLLLLLE